MRRALLVQALAALALAAAPVAPAEVVQRGPLRVVFSGDLTPRTLPRSGFAPVGVAVGGRISTTNGKNPPQLQRVSIAVNRFGRFAPGRLPVCRYEQIQPATTEGALEACRASLIGEGSFSAQVLLPDQAPFPSAGKVHAFNGVYNGRPAILAHVYGAEPAPTSTTLPFRIDPIAKGAFGTMLSASLPRATSEWGYVTGLSLRLGRGLVSAGCPAPKGVPGAVFPLMRASFGFEGGAVLRSTLVRSCKARGG